MHSLPARLFVARCILLPTAGSGRLHDHGSGIRKKRFYDTWTQLGSRAPPIRLSPSGKQKSGGGNRLLHLKECRWTSHPEHSVIASIQQFPSGYDVLRPSFAAGDSPPAFCFLEGRQPSFWVPCSWPCWIQAGSKYRPSPPLNHLYDPIMK